MDAKEVRRRTGNYLKIKEDLDRYLEKHYIPKSEWPSNWWEPGAEDAPQVLPEDQWILDDVELPFI